MEENRKSCISCGEEKAKFLFMDNNCTIFEVCNACRKSRSNKKIFLPSKEEIDTIIESNKQENKPIPKIKKEMGTRTDKKIIKLNASLTRLKTELNDWVQITGQQIKSKYNFQFNDISLLIKKGILIKQTKEDGSIYHKCEIQKPMHLFVNEFYAEVKRTKSEQNKKYRKPVTKISDIKEVSVVKMVPEKHKVKSILFSDSDAIKLLKLAMDAGEKNIMNAIIDSL